MYNPIEIKKGMEARLETLQPEGQTEEQQAVTPVSAPMEDSMNWGRFALDIIETLVLAVVLFLGINAVSARVRVDGFSMRPTLEDGEFVLVSKLNYPFDQLLGGIHREVKHNNIAALNIAKPVI